MSARQHDETPDLPALEQLAIDVASEAARFITRGRTDDLRITTKSSQVDVVTEMDSASQELIAERLRDARPQDAFFGEEESTSPTRTDAPLTWVVDPIDGTVNYLYSFPLYAVSVALVEGDPRVPGAWRPIVGAVADAVDGSVYHARLGGGSHLRDAQGHDVPLRTSGASELATSLVATGFGYDAAKRVRQAHALAGVIGSVRDIRRGGSAALDLCHVAGGRVDAYYEMGINPWDMAAAWLVLTEAGGVCSGATGAPPSTDCVVASAPGIAVEFAALIDSVVDVVRQE